MKVWYINNEGGGFADGGAFRSINSSSLARMIPHL
jgi:hypothetical protein